MVKALRQAVFLRDALATYPGFQYDFDTNSPLARLLENYHHHTSKSWYPGIPCDILECGKNSRRILRRASCHPGQRL